MDDNKYQHNWQYEGKGKRKTYNLRKSSIYVLLIVFITSSLIPSLTLASTICTHHEYWESSVDHCVPCTKCSKHQIVIRPCQRHLDTVCKALNSVEIDWSKSIVMATEKGVRELEKIIFSLYNKFQIENRI
jgi:TNFR/NGFR cysteine-rich region